MADETGEQKGVTGLYRNALDKHGQQIFDILKHDDYGRTFGNTPEEAFEKFASFDPTAERQHKPYGYLNWLCKTFLDSYKEGNEPLLAGDLSDTRYDLHVFHENKKRLPAGTDRDIFKYNHKRLCELVLEITGEDRLSATALKRRQSQKMRQESKIFYDGPEGMIVRPHSVSAAVYWGQGAKWCTAGHDAESYFNQYKNIVIYMPSSVDAYSMKHGYSKFQGCEEYQRVFHAQNQRVDGVPANLKKLVEAALRHDPELYPVFRDHGSFPFSDLSEEFRTKDVWIHELQKKNTLKEEILGQMPREMWADEEVRDVALKQPNVLLFIPDEYKTPDVFIKVLENVGHPDRQAVLDSVPGHHWQDAGFRHQAAHVYPDAYRSCPKKLRDGPMMYAALRNSSSYQHADLVDAMPPKVWGDEAFRQNFADLTWTAFRFCPAEARDRYMSEVAIKNCDDTDYDVLAEVPAELWKDESFFECALTHRCQALGYGREEWRTPQRCLEALQACDEDRDEVMQVVPQSVFYDEDFRYGAAETHWGFIKYCPEELQDKYICLKALVLSEEFERPEALKNITSRMWQDSTFCEAAYALTREAFYYMPHDIQDELFPQSSGLSRIYRQESQGPAGTEQEDSSLQQDRPHPPIGADREPANENEDNTDHEEDRPEPSQGPGGLSGRGM